MEIVSLSYYSLPMPSKKYEPTSHHPQRAISSPAGNRIIAISFITILMEKHAPTCQHLELVIPSSTHSLIARNVNTFKHVPSPKPTPFPPTPFSPVDRDSHRSGQCPWSGK